MGMVTEDSVKRHDALSSCTKRSCRYNTRLESPGSQLPLKQVERIVDGINVGQKSRPVHETLSP